MNDLRINIAEGRTAFEPGSEIMGDATWNLDHPPRAVELRLFWFTRGKGTEDAGIVQTIQFDRPGPKETRSFRFRLPDSPYSFSGKLISLVWALELVAEPSKAVVRAEITVAPGGQEIRLEAVPDDKAKKSMLGFTRAA